MCIRKIECLCEVFLSSFEAGEKYVPLGSYKIFYEDGSFIIKDHILKVEMEASKSIEMVKEFSYEIK